MDQTAIWKVWGPLFVIAIIFAVRLGRAGRDRPLRLGTLWIAPLLVSAIVGALFVSLPPPLIGWAALAVGLVAGAMLGWRRGKLVRVWRREDGRLMQQVSPAAVLILLALFAVRFVVLHLAGGDPTGDRPVRWAITLTDFLLGIAVGMVIFTRVEVFIRARALGRKGAGLG